MRKIIPVLLILIFLSGCKGKKETSVVKVTFWHAMGGPLGRALDNLINDFNTMQDSIKIVSIGMGNYNALSQKIMASILARKTPTIAQVYESWTTSLYKAHVLVPADSFIKKDTLFQKELPDFYNVFIRDNTFDSQLVTIPFNKSVMAYFYNVEMFKAKGIKKFPKTYDELRDVLIKLTSDRTKGTAFGVTVGMFEQLLYAFGGELLDKDRKPVFNSEAGRKALQYLKDLLYKYKVAHLTTGYQHQDEFLSGMVALVEGSSVSYAFMKRNNPDFTIGMAPIPEGEKKAVFIMGTNIAIFERASEKEKRAAWQFIKWFTSPKIQAEWALKTGYVPVRKSSLKIKEVQERFKEVPGLREVWKQLSYARTEPVYPQWYIGRKLLSQVGLEPPLRGGMDVKESLDRAAKEVKRIMEQE